MAGTVASIFRSLPLFKGKDRLARLLLSRKLFRESDLLIAGKSGYRYLLPNIVETIGFEIFINGIYEEETSAFIVRQLPRGGVFLDLGANIGAITVPVTKQRPDVSVIGVEAAPWIFRYLEKNLELNDISVKIFNRALFHTDGEMVPFYSPKEKFGKGSLTPSFTSEAVLVPTVKVDSLLAELDISQVDIIKIDVEGFESQVFQGAGKLLSAGNAPDIIFEFVDWAESHGKVKPGTAQQTLLDMGFQIFIFAPSGPMKPVRQVITTGFHMLYATKNPVA